MLGTLNHLRNFSDVFYEEDELDDEDESDQVAFVACGTDEIFDPDMNYSLLTATQQNANEEESKEPQV